ncbi:MAG: hypothetical protein ACJ8G1_04475 [Vitreoscilla sp.]
MDTEVSASRLDRSVLRYVLLHESRLNMLALERALQALRGTDEQLRLAPGEVRSLNVHRIAVTFQLAAEIQLADPDVVNWIGQDKDGLRRQMAIDAAYFPSELWRTGEAAAFLPWRPQSDWHSGNGAFQEYMRQRTRLHEDAGKQRRQADPPRGTDGAGADADPTMDYLALVAEGVMSMLYERFERHQWHRIAQARAGGVLRMPSPEVFDALLADDRSLVDNFGQWRYSPVNQRPVREESMPRIGDDVATILRISRLLAAELGTVVEEGVFPETLMAILADEVRILPTSPAVSSVARALVDVGQRSSEIGLRPDARQIDDEYLLHEFAALLGLCEDILVLAIACAAFLAGVAAANAADQLGEETIGERTIRALRVLAAGLNFDVKDKDGIRDSLRRFLKGLPGSAARPTKILVPPIDGVARMDELRDRVHVARSVGPDVRVSSALYDAWNQSEERLGLYVETGVMADAGPHELLCAVAQAGPGKWVDIDPRAMTLQDWSDALLAALERSTPEWLAALALRRLGADAASAPQCEALLQALVKALSTAKPPMESTELARLRKAFGARRGDGIQRTLLVVRQPLTRTFEGDAWRQPPADTLVWLFTAPQAQGFGGRVQPLLQALPLPVEIAFEEPVPASAVDSVMITLDLPRRPGTLASAFRNAFAPGSRARLARRFRGEDVCRPSDLFY